MILSDLKLLEKAMNSKGFASTSNIVHDTARVGFEYEMVIPSGSRLHGEPDGPDRPAVSLDWMDDLSEFKDLFEISSSDERSIDKEYEAWVDGMRIEYVKDNWDKFNEEDQDDGEQQAADEFDKIDRSSFKVWIRDEFRNNKHFVDYFGLSPKYGWHDESERNASVYDSEPPDDDMYDATAELVSSDLENIIGEVPQTSQIHGSSKSDYWVIEPDGSIVGDDGDVGIELISPPKKLSYALTQMKAVFNWMNQRDLVTNKSTGLHINISVPNIDKLDPLKLILFLGEEYSADMFGRKNNSYAVSQLKSLSLALQASNKMPDSFEDFKKNIWSYLSKAKYSSVNLSKLKLGYLEFRIAGGIDYHKKVNDVENTVKRYVAALELACDPKLEANTYAKKIAKLLDKIVSTAPTAPASEIKDFPKNLLRLTKFKKGLAALYTTANTFEHKDDMLTFITACLVGLQSYKVNPTELEKVEMKRLINKVGLTSAYIQDVYNDGTDIVSLYKKYLNI